MKTIFITGSTGTIGKELLKEFEKKEARLILLVRNPKKITDQLSWADPTFKKRIKVVKGDLKEERLGLSETDYTLAMAADVIIHAGGTMDVLLEDQEAKQVFSNGAISMIELAKNIQKKNGLKHFIHVVGYMSPFNDSNSYTEDDVWQMDQFMKDGNAYERYKFLADLYVRQQARLNDFPLSVVNPSTIVGDFPTGETEQLAGFGYLVNASRRKLMPVVPGGEKYWLPLVSNNVLAKMIVHLSQEETVESKTYTMTPNKEDSPTMVELNQLIAKELRVAKPKLTVPVPIVATFLKSGIGKLLDMPSETIAFLSEKSFDNQETIKLAHKIGISNLNVNEYLPNVIADIDYRFTFSNQNDMTEFNRQAVDRLIYFKKEGIGTPWVIVHGLFSDAVELKELALAINRKMENPVYIIDLPGLGHSPIVNEAPTFYDYVNSIRTVINAIGVPVNLLGHSLGANLVAKVAELDARKMNQLLLIQPLTQKTTKNTLIDKMVQHQRVAKLVLSKLSKRRVKKYLIDSGSFIEGEKRIDAYSERMYQSLSSPRILATNANLMALSNHESSQINWEGLPNKTTILWGEKDNVYLAPSQNRYPVHSFSYGHQFPISHPNEVATMIQNL